MPHPLTLVLAALLVSLFAPARHAPAQFPEPPRAPVLRIETGMHTAAINRIGVDAANRYLVTASEDKTIRVWELQTGRLLRVIRVPVGEGALGKLSSLALSPDGSTIAVSGFTIDAMADRTISIYLFERESGKLVRRLGGLIGMPAYLAYSPDGRFLAVPLGSKIGVRVYRTSDYSQAAADADYGADGSGAAFDGAGRLVTTSMDGLVRLYAPVEAGGTLRLLAKEKAVGGERPVFAAFSADGSRVAIGFFDSTRVAVMSGRDLSMLYAPDTTGVIGSLNNVAWSADGKTLYAGGMAQTLSSGKYVRAWADGGRGAYRDIPLQVTNTITHLLPLRDGRIVYGAADPAFGAIDSAGHSVLFKNAAMADYRGSWAGFRLAPDGSEVAFAYETLGRSPARFSLVTRELSVAAVFPQNWRAPAFESAGLSVTDWFNGFEPKLNGTRLPLFQYEMSRSLAIAPDAGSFLLGTDLSICLFERSGNLRWRTLTPAVAWLANVTADGRLAVAAYGDGTIRWYRMTDGKELLAFFPHGDRKRWVVWTPEGYYDASPGAEDLIGWHVNNGRDAAADFFPAGQFRNTYYRPDVVARVLQVGDETRALQLANEETGRKQQQADITQQLPPVVEIISPADGAAVSSSEVTVRFTVRSPSNEPVTTLKALVDGRPAGARQLAHETAEAGGTRELKISVPERDSEVSIIAENRFAVSTPATVRLKWRGQAAAAARPESVVIQPKLYILAVGVSSYGNPKYNLKYADKDARDFVAAMQAQKGLLYRDVVVYKGQALTNEGAVKDEVLDGLDWIRRETTNNDVAMVFFAGHGVNDQNNYYYFCPYNVDPERLVRTGVAFSDIKNTVSAVAGKALFFVDTCHSGNSLGLAGRRGSLDINIVINELASVQNGVVVFSASTGSESSQEREEWNNGAFTKALIEGINGAAAIGNTGRITYSMLNIYVSERVKELTKGTQHPTMISPQTVPDFPIAVK